MDMSTAVIPIMGMAIPIILVPTIMAMRQARLERELEHAERMKALELGRTLPRDESWFSPSRICVAFGVGVPIGVFLCAVAAASDSHASPILIWLSAGVVGLAGVLSGAVLAYRHFEHTANGRREADYAGPKPMVDDDAFDVVGSRG